MTCEHVELLIPYKHLKEGRRICGITTVRKASFHWARGVGYIYGFKTGIDLVVVYDIAMGLVKMLGLGVSLVAKDGIFEGDVAIYNVLVVVEVVVKLVQG
jgi:hypothetical protein